MNRRYPNHRIIQAGDYNPIPNPDAALVEEQLEVYDKADLERLIRSSGHRIKDLN